MDWDSIFLSCPPPFQSLLNSVSCKSLGVAERKMFPRLYELKRQMCKTKFRMQWKDTVKNCKQFSNSQPVVQSITYHDNIIMNLIKTTSVLFYCLIIWVFTNFSPRVLLMHLSSLKDISVVKFRDVGITRKYLLKQIRTSQLCIGREQKFPENLVASLLQLPYPSFCI